MANDRAGRATRADRSLIAGLRDEMRTAADPVRAAAQQAYMKSALPYYGLPSPRLKAELGPLLRD